MTEAVDLELLRPYLQQYNFFPKWKDSHTCEIRYEELQKLAKEWKQWRLTRNNKDVDSLARALLDHKALARARLPNVNPRNSESDTQGASPEEMLANALDRTRTVSHFSERISIVNPIVNLCCMFRFLGVTCTMAISSVSAAITIKASSIDPV